MAVFHAAGQGGLGEFGGHVPTGKHQREQERQAEHECAYLVAYQGCGEQAECKTHHQEQRCCNVTGHERARIRLTEVSDCDREGHRARQNDQQDKTAGQELTGNQLG